MNETFPTTEFTFHKQNKVEQEILHNMAFLLSADKLNISDVFRL